MARKPQAKGRNSTSAHVEAFKYANMEVQPPEGVVLENEEEVVAWRHFTRARAVADWRAIDLIMLYKAVKCEVKLKAYEKMVETEGAVVDNSRGTKIVNPYMHLIDSLTRQQMAIFKSMSMSYSGSEKLQTQARAKTEQEKRDIIANTDDDDAVLLARPN